VYVRFPSTSVGQGWVRFVRFQEVGRAQQMTEKGA
jgi:L-rhamnose isomerase